MKSIIFYFFYKVDPLMRDFLSRKANRSHKSYFPFVKMAENMWVWYSRPIHLKISKLSVQTGKALSGLVNDDKIIFILKLKKTKQKKT